MNVTILRRETDVVVTVDAYPAFGVKAKELGGTAVSLFPWSWRFPVDREQDVRALCVEVYGHDGEPGETVTCWVAVPDDGLDSLWGLGRRLAIRYHPLDAVKLGHGVSLVRGGFPSTCGRGGRLNPDAYTVLEVHDVPAILARREAERSHGMVDVVGETDAAALVKLHDITNRLSDRTTGGALRAGCMRGPDDRSRVNLGPFTAEVWPGHVCVAGPQTTPEWYPRGADYDVATRLLQLASYGFIETEGERLRNEESR